MIIETVNIKEYHDNGTLWIDEVRCYVSEASIGFYGSNIIKSFLDGRYFFRKSVVKYYDNGQFAWQQNKDNSGNPIIINNRQFRKDGTGIMY